MKNRRNKKEKGRLKSNMSKIALSVNGYTISIKRQRLAQLIKKHQTMCCVQLQINNIIKLKIKRQKKIHHANRRQ